jgi:hypothetical protein
MQDHEPGGVPSTVLTANMSFRMFGSRRPTAALPAVREDARAFCGLVRIADRTLAAVNCGNISRVARKLAKRQGRNIPNVSKKRRAGCIA